MRPQRPFESRFEWDESVLCYNIIILNQPRAVTKKSHSTTRPDRRKEKTQVLHPSAIRGA